MKIAVLAHNLISSGGLSVGRNITALLPKIRPEHQYLIVVPENLDYEEHSNNDKVCVKQVSQMNILQRIKYDLISLPKIIKDFKADVILALGNIGMSNHRCKQAILIHQPQVMYSSKHYGDTSFYDRLRIWAIKQRIKKCLKITELIFCQTLAAQKRFAESFCYPIEKIKIIPNAVSEFAKVSRKNLKINPVLDKNGVFNLFFLTRYMPHKNLEILINLFRNHNELKDVRCIITIEDNQHKNAKKLLNRIIKYKLQDKIINVGQLQQEELAGYFLNCDALLFPTLLESFSGTYLEAMYFNLPILTSDLDFARCVCNDSALYFDPWDPEDIVKIILKLKRNPELKKELIQKGSERLNRFFVAWPDVVESMLKEIEMI